MKKKSILILHGWGVHRGKYQEIIDELKKEGFDAYAPDLPGFGEEKLRRKAMCVDDYVDFVKSFVASKELTNIVLIAHSFGGRIAIKLAALGYPNLTGLILTGSAGIKPKLAFPKRAVMYFAISMGELFRFPFLASFKDKIRKLLYFMIGEWDYYSAGDLRETFKKVIAEDLTSYLPKITIPTLLIWGERDRTIPLSDARRMKDFIPDAKLLVVPGATHTLPYAMPHVFVEKILPFLKQ